MSAPVSRGKEIKPMTAINAMMIAAKKALPKPLTLKLGTSAAVSIIINALMTRANKPKVTTDKGAVKNHRAGRRKALIIPRTVVAITKAMKLLALTPGTIKVAAPRPMAVANQAISKAVIINFSV